MKSLDTGRDQQNVMVLGEVNGTITFPVYDEARSGHY